MILSDFGLEDEKYKLRDDFINREKEFSIIQSVNSDAFSAQSIIKGDFSGINEIFSFSFKGRVFEFFDDKDQIGWDLRDKRYSFISLELHFLGWRIWFYIRFHSLF